MENIPNEKNRETNIAHIQRAINSIPEELIDKFPGYKVIIEMVNQMVNEGYGQKEIERKIAQSKEYIKLEKVQDEIHKFQNELEGIDLEKDLKEWEKNRMYVERIQNAANKVYIEMGISANNESINEDSESECNTPIHWFEQIGYVITEKQVTLELAKIGKLACLNRAFNVLDLLAFLTGVAILPRDGNNDTVPKIIEKKDILCEYIGEFERTYKVR